MKVIAVCGLLLVFSAGISAKQKTQPEIVAKVDERIELTIIVARLAEFGEYVRNDNKLYAEAVDKHFSKYKEHPVVALATRLRESNGIGFDAVPSLAVHLKPDLTPKFKFSDTAPDKRWGASNAEEFARLLKRFYKDADCSSFFKANAAVYKTAEERFQKVLEKVDIPWYQKFYGEAPKAKYNLYIGLLNGGMNFGPKVVYPNGREELYAVIGTWQTDSQGLPVYDDSFISTIIHEFNHSFVNHHVYENETALRPGGEKIFPLVAEKMRRQAYGNWQTMMLESIVRAAVVRYMLEHGDRDNAADELRRQRQLGFIWMAELSDLLAAYEADRKRYPTFRSFMPKIVEYYSALIPRIDEMVALYQKQLPKVVAIEEFKNGAQDVDPTLTKITVVFDRPMVGKGISINLGDLGRDHYPLKREFSYNSDKTKVTLMLEMKPEREYSFTLTGLAFISTEGFPIDNYQVKFKTRK